MLRLRGITMLALGLLQLEKEISLYPIHSCDVVECVAVMWWSVFCDVVCAVMWWIM